VGSVFHRLFYADGQYGVWLFFLFFPPSLVNFPPLTQCLFSFNFFWALCFKRPPTPKHECFPLMFAFLRVPLLGFSFFCSLFLLGHRSFFSFTSPRFFRGFCWEFFAHLFPLLLSYLLFSYSFFFFYPGGLVFCLLPGADSGPP